MTHQSQHARRLFNGSAASEETHDHHQSPRRDQDVHAYRTTRDRRDGLTAMSRYCRMFLLVALLQNN